MSVVDRSIAGPYLFVATAALVLSACSSEPASSPPETTAANVAAPAEPAAAPATAATAPVATAAAAPPADSTDTLTGVKLASYTGDVAAGEKVFIQCKTCHVTDAGVNRIGPSLHSVVGRVASTVPAYTYSAANKASGITWNEDKLFQYLEKPQRVVPGTKMAFAGISDPQKRADVIAYLKTQS